jgi:hypothetical protein
VTPSDAEIVRAVVTDWGRDTREWKIVPRDAEQALARLAALAERAEQYEEAIRWALGERGDWPPRLPLRVAFYWRKELRRRAALDGKDYPPLEGLEALCEEGGDD